MLYYDQRFLNKLTALLLSLQSLQIRLLLGQAIGKAAHTNFH